VTGWPGDRFNRDRLADLAYALGWGLTRRLPEPAVRSLARLGADIAWRRGADGVGQLERNLARVVGAAPEEPRVRELSRAAMRSYLRYWCEVFRLPEWSAQRVLREVRPSGEENLFGPLAAGRGVVAVLPHTGNWDLAGAWAVARGVRFTTVAERLRPEKLFDRFVAYRQHLGMEVVPLTGGGSTFGLLSRRLREGRMVALLGDRDLTASGVQVSFFGEPARMPAGPAALALHTGAALMPAHLWYGEGGLHVDLLAHVEAPANGTRQENILAMTQRVADVFAARIADHPEDWHMLQRLWVADLDGGHPGAPR
jgi:phosphatidylinositol dimannoside acyltransferase